MTTMAQARVLAESYWAAECRRDNDAVMGHYHHDATFQPAGPPLRGTDRIRAYYDASGEAFPGLEITVGDGYASTTAFAFEWSGRFTHTSGQVIELDGINTFTIRDGRFVAVRAYYDSAVFNLTEEN